MRYSCAYALTKGWDDSGNAYLLQISQFRELYDAPGNVPDPRYTFDVLAAFSDLRSTPSLPLIPFALCPHPIAITVTVSPVSTYLISSLLA